MPTPTLESRFQFAGKSLDGLMRSVMIEDDQLVFCKCDSDVFRELSVFRESESDVKKSKEKKFLILIFRHYIIILFIDKGK